MRLSVDVATSNMTKIERFRAIIVLGFFLGLVVGGIFKHFADRKAMKSADLKYVVCTQNINFWKIDMKECVRTNFYDIMSDDCVHFIDVANNHNERIFCGYYTVEEK